MDFYNYFSFSGKKAIYRASEICVQFNNQHLEPEHLFFSILNLRKCSAMQVLHQLEVHIPKLNYSLEAYLYEHAGSFKGTASFSVRTLTLLDNSFKEIKRMHHREIGSTHLLLALSEDQSTFLRRFFEEHNLTSKLIRDTFMKHLESCSAGQDRTKEEKCQSAFEEFSPGLTATTRDYSPPRDPVIESQLYDDRVKELMWLAEFLAKRLRHGEFGIPHLMYAYLTRDEALRQVERIYGTGPLRPGSVLVKLVSELDRIDPLPAATDPEKSAELITLISGALEWSLLHTRQELIEFAPFTDALLRQAAGQFKPLLAGCTPDSNRTEQDPDSASAGDSPVPGK